MRCGERFTQSDGMLIPSQVNRQDFFRSPMRLSEWTRLGMELGFADSFRVTSNRGELSCQSLHRIIWGKIEQSFAPCSPASFLVMEDC